MGETITRSSAGVNRETDKQPNTDRQPATGTGTAGTTSPRTGVDSRTATGTTAGTEKGTDSKTPAELAVLTEEQKKAEARRQQKAESQKRAQARKEALAKGEPIPEWAEKRQSGTAPKKTAAKKPEPAALDAGSIQNLIKTVFDLVGSRPNAAHWKLTDTECRQLAEPIADILSEYAAASEAIAQNSKYIALVMAAFAICAPRIMLSMSMKKARKEAEHGIIAKPKAPVRNTPAHDEGRKAGSGSTGSSEHSSANGTEHVPNLYELISTI